MRGRRGARLRWAVLVVAVVLLAGGGTVVYLGYRDTAGPAGAVRGYFAALQRGDAAAALAYGDVPAGPRTLLSGAGLGDQRRAAPLRQLHVGGVQTHGERADVTARYVLDFPGDPQQVQARVPVHRHDGDWRLDRVAVATQLAMGAAAQRATVLGTRLGGGTVLMFPGAVPVRLDTPYLSLSPHTSVVDFATGATTTITAGVTDAGRERVETLVSANLRACLTGRGARTCPTPAGRFVPGSLRGTLVDSTPDLHVALGSSPVGVLEVTGTARVSGSYRKLTFDNRVRSGKGTVSVPIDAQSYAVAPLRLVWTAAAVVS